MNAVIYLTQRFIYRISEFLRHWYMKSAKIYANFVIDQLERLDYTLAWKITLKNLFQPLYKDYSAIGYVLGFIFRAGRLALASVAYLIIFLIAILMYMVWLLILPYVAVRVFL